MRHYLLDKRYTRSVTKQRIAIIGSGVAGLVAARLLHRRHDVTVFEARDRVGGHVCTVDVPADRRAAARAIDIGFIVYNEQNYPLFTRLIEQLGVETQPASMSFGVRCDRTGLEYGGENAEGSVRAAVEPGQPRLLRDAARTSCASTARPRPRCETAPPACRSASTCRGPSSRGRDRALPVADGLGVMVDPARSRSRDAGGVLRPLLREPRSAHGERAAPVEGDQGRVEPVRRGARGAVP